MLSSFAEIEKAVRSQKRRRVVVPGAANACFLEAALEAHERELADFVLIDSRARLVEALAELGRDAATLSDFEVLEEEDCATAAKLGVRLVRDGKADLIGKGRLQTFELMRAVLDKEEGLRGEDSLLSDVMLIERPQARKKSLVLMTDPALVILPSVEDLVRITRNAVAVFHRLGVERPRVAFLAALEVVKESMPATVHAAELARRVNAGEIPGCVAEGPLSMDIACSPRAAAVKGTAGEVAGKADLLVVPNLEAGNILAKTVSVWTKAAYAHMVVGAKVPIIMSSRSDSGSCKFNSMLLGLLCAGERA